MKSLVETILSLSDSVGVCLTSARYRIKKRIDPRIVQDRYVPFVLGLRKTAPASFILKLEKSSLNLSGVEDIASQVERLSEVEDLEYGRSWISKLEKIFLTFFVVDLIFGILLAFTVILVIGNSVRLSIYRRTSSIQVMRLLGASPRFVSQPFILEGMIQGIIGAGLGILFLFIIYQIFSIKFFKVEFLPMEIIAGLILWGIFLGGAGGFFAIRKHL